MIDISPCSTHPVKYLQRYSAEKHLEEIYLASVRIFVERRLSKNVPIETPKESH